MDPTQTAIVLATPIGVAVVGALLWWRVGQVEREQRERARADEAMALRVAEMKGAVDALKEIVVQVFRSATGGRRRLGNGAENES